MGVRVLVRGVRAPVVGAVSMDMSMVDVTDAPGVTGRDEFVEPPRRQPAQGHFLHRQSERRGCGRRQLKSRRWRLGSPAARHPQECLIRGRVPSG